MPITPEVEFILSVASLLLAAFLTWIAFTHTKWAWK